MCHREEASRDDGGGEALDNVFLLVGMEVLLRLNLCCCRGKYDCQVKVCEGKQEKRTEEEGKMNVTKKSLLAYSALSLFLSLSLSLSLSLFSSPLSSVFAIRHEAH